ncbi:DUF975 family protein [Streptococcus sp. SS-4456]|uniref:DUF975 family protein n=1 Tax=Streptococcus sp. SS-4456 TaxID=3072286 RepID=UPI002FC72F10
MFTIFEIREKARQTIHHTDGIYQVAAVPVILSVIVQLFSASRNSLVGLTPEDIVSPGYLFSTSLFPLFYGLLLGLLQLSVLWTLFQVTKNIKQATSFKDCISIFSHKDFGKVFKTYILKSFLLFLWGLVFYLGLGLIIGSTTVTATIILSTGSTDPNLLPQDLLALLGILLISGMFLTIIGLAIYIPQIYAYSQVEFILFEQLEREEYTGAFSIIKASRKLMKGYKFKHFVLDLSFIGWFALIIITFGLAGLYVWPYHYLAQSYFHEGILDDQAPKMNYLYE